MAAKSKSAKEPRFEDALARLEEIVGELESGDPPLERALELFEEGVGLGRRCSVQLEEAEHRIRLLVERSDGSLAEEALPDRPAGRDALGAANGAAAGRAGADRAAAGVDQAGDAEDDGIPF